MSKNDSFNVDFENGELTVCFLRDPNLYDLAMVAIELATFIKLKYVSELTRIDLEKIEKLKDLLFGMKVGIDMRYLLLVFF